MFAPFRSKVDSPQELLSPRSRSIFLDLPLQGRGGSDHLEARCTQKPQCCQAVLIHGAEVAEIEPVWGATGSEHPLELGHFRPGESTFDKDDSPRRGIADGDPERHTTISCTTRTDMRFRMIQTGGFRSGKGDPLPDGAAVRSSRRTIR